VLALAVNAPTMNIDEVRLVIRDGIENLEEWRDSMQVVPLVIQAGRAVAVCLAPTGRGKLLAQEKIAQLKIPRAIANIISSLVFLTREEDNLFFHSVSYHYSHRLSEEDSNVGNEIIEFYESAPPVKRWKK
jgi:hypothetical protein